MKHRPLDVDTLWRIERIGPPALSPDGRRAVVSVTTASMADNTSASRLWLLHTTTAAPRALTACGDKDSQPAWSPRGGRIAFIARREQQGKKDASAQLYLIAPDGGEAARASHFAPGIESFKWLPDGRRVVFAAWVWPELKGAKAQARRHKEFSERKESGYATGEAFYRFFDHNLPQGRVLHLLLLDLKTGRVDDLFEATRYELPRQDLGNEAYDVSPDGGRIAFVHDAAREAVLGNALALSEIDLRSRRVKALIDDPAWEFGAPRYSPDGSRLAFTAAHIGVKHTMLPKLAVRGPGRGWRVVSQAWDRAIGGPLRWAADGQSLLFAAEDRGRCHLWRHALDAGTPECVHQGGWVQSFDSAGETTLVGIDAIDHPVQIHALRAGAASLRLERFNDELLRKVAFGRLEEVSLKGALGDAVQMWLFFPPGFDDKRRHPVNQVIHGGPFNAAGDTFSYRWNPNLLASRGHVLAQVNFHGSSGFGFAFRDSLIGRQGELELQDIEAGTDWLLQQPWADATRVYASGGSYGGFMVAWMNGHIPCWPEGRYRAYVCHAGVFDRIATFSADSYPERPKDLAALFWQDMPRVLAQSPHNFAATMNTPTLVIHGAQDFRVPDCNGLAYYNTLKARGVAARLLWFPDENHWVLKAQNSKLWYREFLDWLEAHQPPKAPGLEQGQTR